MARPDQSNALNYVVVIMFENRSLDNLLGRLYKPGEVKSFEGVLGKNLSNPIPEWAEHGADRKAVPYGVAKTMDTPNPDSGEEYPHVNTQVFRLIDPSSNRGISYAKMTAPYNAPSDTNPRPTMDGFVADYVSTFTSEMKRQPTYDEYEQIMTGHSPEQVPVVSALARGFATFDHWFCEVPSQTFPGVPRPPEQIEPPSRHPRSGVSMLCSITYRRHRRHYASSQVLAPERWRNAVLRGEQNGEKAA